MDSTIWTVSMNLSESSHIWRKRWKLTLLLLVLASAGVGYAAITLPRSYQSDSSVVLLASRSAARQNGGNPYLSFSPSLTLTADALSQQVTAPGTIQDLAARGFDDPYTVALAPYSSTTTGSVLVVTVTGSNAAAAENMMNAVTSELSVKLSYLQIGIRPRDQIRAARLFSSPRAMLSVSQTLRPLVIVTALALLFVFGIPIVVDGRITRQRSRRPERRFRSESRGMRLRRQPALPRSLSQATGPLAGPGHGAPEPNGGGPRRARAGKSAD